jgi:N utilization substance protein A
VNELQGEKIDIVHYSEDTREYIKAALSPAEISEIKLDKDKQKAEVIVADDQLSLSIGRHGQNVRLASKLIGLELDIRTKAMVAAAEQEKEKAKEKAAKEKEVVPAEKEEKKKKREEISLSQLTGVGEKTLSNLKEAGINTVEDVLKSGLEGLVDIKGIGKKKAESLIDEAKKIKSRMG